MRPAVVERRQHPPLAPVQVPLSQRLLARDPEAALEAADAVDDPLDLGVEAGDVLETFEEGVDLVALESLRHRAHSREYSSIRSNLTSSYLTRSISTSRYSRSGGTYEDLGPRVREVLRPGTARGAPRRQAAQARPPDPAPELTAELSAGPTRARSRALCRRRSADRRSASTRSRALRPRARRSTPSERPRARCGLRFPSRPRTRRRRA